MSKRFLKYETEADNPMIDENGVLQSNQISDNIIKIFYDFDKNELYLDGIKFEVRSNEVDVDNDDYYTEIYVLDKIIDYNYFKDKLVIFKYSTGQNNGTYYFYRMEVEDGETLVYVHSDVRLFINICNFVNI